MSMMASQIQQRQKSKYFFKQINTLYIEDYSIAKNIFQTEVAFKLGIPWK